MNRTILCVLMLSIWSSNAFALNMRFLAASTTLGLGFMADESNYKSCDSKIIVDVAGYVPSTAELAFKTYNAAISELRNKILDHCPDILELVFRSNNNTEDYMSKSGRWQLARLKEDGAIDFCVPTRGKTRLCQNLVSEYKRLSGLFLSNTFSDAKIVNVPAESGSRHIEWLIEGGAFGKIIMIKKGELAPLDSSISVLSAAVMKQFATKCTQDNLAVSPESVETSPVSTGPGSSIWREVKCYSRESAQTEVRHVIVKDDPNGYSIFIISQKGIDTRAADNFAKRLWWS